MILTIGYLYGELMNIYGDTGNVTVLSKRCEWRGIEVKIKPISIGDSLKKGDCDLYFFGGGQDQSQVDVSHDLSKSSRGRVLKAEIDRGVPLLSICGGYQLLGEFYEPFEGPKLQGIGLFPAFTKASSERMIGNIIIESQFGQLVGFENHSGKTYLKEDALPLGKIIKGFGNNGDDKTEGCLRNNAIGCYMHGSLLPKNPILADWLIQKALEIKYEKAFDLIGLDDGLENRAQSVAINLDK